MQVAMLFTVCTLLIAGGCAQEKNQLSSSVGQPKVTPEGAAVHTHPLFIIERSKNANVVHYDARLTPDGRLDPGEPVIAYYVMLAEDGRRKELSWIEKTLAYGFEIEPGVASDEYKMTMVAARDRSITVRKVGKTVCAELLIDGRPAVVEKIYIKFSEGLFRPKVHYMEPYGKDVQTAEKRYEKVFPK